MALVAYWGTNHNLRSCIHTRISPDVCSAACLQPDVTLLGFLSFLQATSDIQIPVHENEHHRDSKRGLVCNMRTTLHQIEQAMHIQGSKGEGWLTGRREYSTLASRRNKEIPGAWGMSRLYLLALTYHRRRSVIAAGFRFDGLISQTKPISLDEKCRTLLFGSSSFDCEDWPCVAQAKTFDCWMESSHVVLCRKAYSCSSLPQSKIEEWQFLQFRRTNILVYPKNIIKVLLVYYSVVVLCHSLWMSYENCGGWPDHLIKYGRPSWTIVNFQAAFFFYRIPL